jgi:catechol-2,3-dioxygenase
VTDVAAPVVELRLLTHRPQEMAAWWAALLGGGPHSLNSRMTAVTGRSLRVVIERSQIALDYHPEASGVTAINLTLGDTQEVHRALNRLARLGFAPYRATRNPGAIALWLHDPNGTDVALCLPAPPATRTANADILADELDVKAVLADTRTLDQRQ